MPNRGFQKGNKLGDRFQKGRMPWNIGIPHSEETKRKMSKVAKGRKLSEETKKKIGKAHKGKKLSEETKNRMKKNHKGMLGKKHTKKTQCKMSEAKAREKNSNWQGGISFEPYSVDWTETLRRSIRERDHYICQLCNGYGRSVHHIDYNKKNCDPTNLITLCVSCNCKVNYNREYWMQYFQLKT